MPTIIGVAETSIRAVPGSYYEGSLALGATHERSVFFAQLPAATSGVMSGVILGVGRAIGETMAVIMIAGNQPIMPRGLLEGLRTMTANVVLEMGYASGLHRRVGMVFQKPNPFPMSVYDNIAYGPRTHGVRKKAMLDEIVERSLRQAAIWEELKDRLKKSALGLSGGQQQRLCIARALAVEPEVLLMDEPTSALDPISTAKIEDLAAELKKQFTIVIVTHNMQQAVRISDRTAFFLLGEMVEFGATESLFSMPRDKRTEDYITGRFG